MSFVELIHEFSGKQLLIGGHRGHLSATRENTVGNFAELIGTGIRYIEIDIQLTKDNEAVIFHDRELSEKTPLSGSIREHTLSELRDAFVINTLEEALCWCSQNEIYALLEVKSAAYSDSERKTLADKIGETISSGNFRELCIMLSIDQKILSMLREAVPDVTLAVIVPERAEDPTEIMRKTGALIYLSYLKDMDEQTVAALHGAGYIVDGSVINSREDLSLAHSMKVDMAESDDPVHLLKLYTETAGEYADS